MRRIPSVHNWVMQNYIILQLQIRFGVYCWCVCSWNGNMKKTKTNDKKFVSLFSIIIISTGKKSNIFSKRHRKCQPNMCCSIDSNSEAFQTEKNCVFFRAWTSILIELVCVCIPRCKLLEYYYYSHIFIRISLSCMRMHPKSNENAI